MADEIELKFKIENYKDIVEKLQKFFNLNSSAYEVTIMYDEEKKLFNKDARLRLRRIFDLKTGEEKTEISYKKPKTRKGIKIEEEYEVIVSNFKEIEIILNKIGFSKISSYERIRDTFKKNNIKITVDSFPFGDFLEIEGEFEKIKEIAEKLKLDMSKNITKSCDDIYTELCQEKGKKVNDNIYFENKLYLEKQKQKRDILFQ